MINKVILKEIDNEKVKTKFDNYIKENEIKNIGINSIIKEEHENYNQFFKNHCFIYNIELNGFNKQKEEIEIHLEYLIDDNIDEPYVIKEKIIKYKKKEK